MTSIAELARAELLVRRQLLAAQAALLDVEIDALSDTIGHRPDPRTVATALQAIEETVGAATLDQLGVMHRYLTIIVDHHLDSTGRVLGYVAATLRAFDALVELHRNQGIDTETSGLDERLAALLDDESPDGDR